MNSDGLLSLVAFSKVRKNLLVMLCEGPRSLSEIKDVFNMSSPELLPRIKELLNNNLIYNNGNKYRITPLGTCVIYNFVQLTDTFRVIESNEKYWKEHRLNTIPQDLINKISKLGNCSIIENKHENINLTHEVLLDNISRSNSLMGISTIFHPEYPDAFIQLANRGVPMSLIFTKNVYDFFRENYINDINQFLGHDNHIYIIDEDVYLGLITTDSILILSLAYNSGDFDYSKYLISQDDSALDWGMELFNYYRRKSKEITIV